MEKLIELLNEYEKEKNDLKFKPKFWEIYRGHLSFLEYNDKYSELLCISKRYEFIQRLVKNNKIDFSREGDLSIELVNLFERKLDNAEGVIALLSIQDNPISFLISILR